MGNLALTVGKRWKDSRFKLWRRAC
jgi:hypothetical protein